MRKMFIRLIIEEVSEDIRNIFNGLDLSFAQTVQQLNKNHMLFDKYKKYINYIKCGDLNCVKNFNCKYHPKTKFWFFVHELYDKNNLHTQHDDNVRYSLWNEDVLETEHILDAYEDHISRLLLKSKDKSLFIVRKEFIQQRDEYKLRKLVSLERELKQIYTNLYE